jgi:hypothetical protein
VTWIGIGDKLAVKNLLSALHGLESQRPWFGEIVPADRREISSTMRVGTMKALAWSDPVVRSSCLGKLPALGNFKLGELHGIWSA